MDDDTEPPLDPKAVATRPALSQYDLEDHRCTVYIGYYVPSYRRKSHHKRHGHHHHHHHHHSKPSFNNGADCVHDISTPVAPPSERVHFILGEEEAGSHEPHPLFSEMEELFYDGDEVEWRETARWIKFEEDVEESGNRWSKPHVATVSLHSLFELRSCMLNGSVILDMELQTFEEIIDSILDDVESHNLIPSNSREFIKQLLMRPHRHQHELHHEWTDKGARLPIIRSFTEVGRNSSRISAHHVLSLRSSFTPHMSSVEEEKNESSSGNSASAGAISDHTISNLSSLSFRGSSSGRSGSSPEESSTDIVQHRDNQSFMRKIPPKAEASNILIGEVECLEKVVSCFIRLNESCKLGDLTEVPVPTRFIFVLLGPTGHGMKYHEIGRAMATLLSDDVFHGVAYKAKTRSDLLAGVDEFLDATTVLPPGVWDPSTRIEPPDKTASQDGRVFKNLQVFNSGRGVRYVCPPTDEEQTALYLCNLNLKESRKKPDPNKNENLQPCVETIECKPNYDMREQGRLFGGLFDDIKRKAVWYLSDIKDVFALQCISSIVFLYFACITQIITFGGLLAEYTGNNISASECILSALICGIAYSLFSGQPLVLLGNTGPILVYEGILYTVCKEHSYDYMTMRMWIGLWTSFCLVLLVSLNVAQVVKYITRFTEEIFALLVSVFFIYNSVLNVVQIDKVFPFKTGFRPPPVPLCFCHVPMDPNITASNETQCQSLNGTSVPVGCSYTPPFYVPDIFLMSFILFLGTFTIILLLREVKNTPFLPSKMRIAIADFAVIGAVVIMTIVDHVSHLNTPKLEVPQTFSPSSQRGWLIPFFGTNPWWAPAVAPLPAIFLTLNVFMDQEITTVLVNRKENKLKKGAGYHLDLFVLAVLIALCSILGLPWFVAATILSITHVNSLKYASRCSTPGEKSRFIGVREQRMTHFTVYLLIGCSFFFADVLQFIPMPVLYGVFLFMGVTSMKGLQFFERITIMFMSEKYQPDYSYLRCVPIKKVVIFTSVQMVMVVILFACKCYPYTAVFFPFLLLGVFAARKLLSCVIFDQAELKMLDDVMPETTQFKKDDNSIADQNSNLSEVMCIDGENGKPPMNHRNSHANINISEVLAQSSIWKSINQQSSKATKRFFIAKTKKKKRHHKRDSSKSEEHRRLSVMEEEDEDNQTSTSLSSPPPPSVPSENVSPDPKSAASI